MITIEGALKDLDEIEKEAGQMTPIIKAIKVIVKMLSTIRSNQLLLETDKIKIQAEKTSHKIKKA